MIGRMKTARNAFVPVLGTVAILSGSVLVGSAGQQPAAPRGPAPSLVHAGSAPKAPDAAGFLQRWLILEPIRVVPQLTDAAAPAALKKEYFPNQFTLMPPDADSG